MSLNRTAIGEGLIHVEMEARYRAERLAVAGRHEAAGRALIVAVTAANELYAIDEGEGWRRFKFKKPGPASNVAQQIERAGKKRMKRKRI